MLKNKIKSLSRVHHHILNKKYKPLHYSLVSVISVVVILAAVFSVTRGGVPFSSELAYIEKSFISGNVGSVIPASCESGVEHSAGECFCYGNSSCGVCGNAACCVANTGAGCSSSANSCGDTNYGTIQCDGSCSVSSTAPAERPYWNNYCASAANSCGDVSYGYTDCSGTCPATRPAERAGWNTACNPANVCGRTNSGAIQCDGSCSVSAPSNNTCIPTSVAISSTPSVGAGKSSTVVWSSANGAAGCEIRKRTFISAGDPGGDVVVIRNSTTPNGSLSDGPLPVPTTVQGQTVLLGRGYYVAYKTRCWDSSGTMFSDYSAEAVTRVGSARLWFTP